MRRRTKIVIGVVATPLALVALVWTVGACLPAAHTATVEARFASPPAVLWSAVSDLEGSAAWRPSATRVVRLADRDGRAVYEETNDFGPVRYEVVEATPPARLVTRIVDEAEFGGTWTYVLADDGGGTRLTITEDGVVHAPVFRFVSRFVMGHDATLRTYLGDLQRHVP